MISAFGSLRFAVAQFQPGQKILSIFQDPTRYLTRTACKILQDLRRLTNSFVQGRFEKIQLAKRNSTQRSSIEVHKFLGLRSWNSDNTLGHCGAFSIISKFFRKHAKSKSISFRFYRRGADCVELFAGWSFHKRHPRTHFFFINVLMKAALFGRRRLLKKLHGDKRELKRCGEYCMGRYTCIMTGMKCVTNKKNCPFVCFHNAEGLSPPEMQSREWGGGGLKFGGVFYLCYHHYANEMCLVLRSWESLSCREFIALRMWRWEMKWRESLLQLWGEIKLIVLRCAFDVWKYTINGICVMLKGALKGHHLADLFISLLVCEVAAFLHDK